MGDGGWAAIRIQGLEGFEYGGELLRMAEECEGWRPSRGGIGQKCDDNLEIEGV